MFLYLIRRYESNCNPDEIQALVIAAPSLKAALEVLAVDEPRFKTEVLQTTEQIGTAAQKVKAGIVLMNLYDD